MDIYYTPIDILKKQNKELLLQNTILKQNCAKLKDQLQILRSGITHIKTNENGEEIVLNQYKVHPSVQKELLRLNQALGRKNNQVQELKNIQKVMVSSQTTQEWNKLLQNSKRLEQQNQRLRAQLNQGVIQNFRTQNSFLRERASDSAMNLTREKDRINDLEEEIIELTDSYSTLQKNYRSLVEKYDYEIRREKKGGGGSSGAMGDKYH